MRSIKFILLPILGVLAAIIAFKLAGPFEGTLSRPDLGPDDPRALFTYGTRWGDVNRIAFGALVCGPFAVVLTLGRRSPLRVIFAGILGAALGGLVNFVTDSGSDMFGLFLSGKSAEFGSLMAMFAWCALVPLGIALSITVALGVTPERLRRALYSAKWASIASFYVQIVGGFLGAPDPSSENLLQSQIPVWRLVEIAVGIALGVTILIADEWIRVASIRQLHGRNEFRDWSIDHAVTHIGSAEGCEIPLFGLNGVEPVHAIIVRQATQFQLEARGHTLLNGHPVTTASLQSGDQITIANVVLVFTAQGGFYRPVSTRNPSIPIALQNPNPIFIPQPQATPYQPVGVATSHPSPTKMLVDGHGQRLPLALGRYGVGRENTNPICLYNDSQVAPNHAVIMVSDVGIEVVDLGAPTGTKINGTRISGLVALKLGDTVEFGSTRFTYTQ